jgi:hypothetical protein
MNRIASMPVTERRVVFAEPFNLSRPFRRNHPAKSRPGRPDVSG